MIQKLKIHVEYDTTTGMDQGLWPRFYLQMLQLSQLALGQFLLDEKIEKIRIALLPELEQLQDAYHKIMNGILEFEIGVANGRFYKGLASGGTQLDRGVEIVVRREVKDFITQAKRVYVVFAKSGFTDERGFSFKTYGLKKDLTPLIDSYRKSRDSKYLPLLLVLQKANNDFLNDLNLIRGDIEHETFAIDPFELVPQGEGAVVRQPMIQGVPMAGKLAFYFHYMLDLIEKLMVYYIGINVESILPGMAELFVDDHCDPVRQHYRYTFTFGGVGWSETARRCTYD